MDSLRTILAIGVANGWFIEQMDIISVYLAGTLDEEIYMNTPEGLRLIKDTVVQVIKALYGLKQSGRVWYKRIEATLNAFGLKHTDNDWSVFINKDHSLIVGIYVDDLVIMGVDTA